MMKLFVGSIATETNTFSPFPTGMADYEIVRGNELYEERNQHFFKGGMDWLKDWVEERGGELVFSLAAFAQPAGLTVRAVYEQLRDEMLEALKAAMPVDIVILPLHGSMIAEGYDDCETDMLQRVREIVGKDVFVGVELDLHCDITDEMLELSDAIISYKEYPHIDSLPRLKELVKIAEDTINGKIRPVMATFDCRMIGMYLTPFEPMRSFVDEMIAAESKDGLLSLSLTHCFPWADMPTTTAKMLAITNNDREQARQLAETWGRKFFALRHEVDRKPLTLDEAMDKALANPNGPVVIADQSDNPGGGAPSDSTFALRALLERGATNAAVAMIWDPIVVQIALSAGVGARLKLRVGGKMGPMSGDPLDLDVTVTAVSENLIVQVPSAEGDVPSTCGRAAALSCNGIDIIVNDKRGQVFSTGVFTEMGIDPTKKHILVVKSTQHFYAAYAPIASEVIYMAAPGAIAPLMKEIPYTQVDLNKYPWVDDPFAEA